MTLTLRIAALGLALAATPAAAQVKLGYVDLQRALNEVDEGKAAKALLKRDFEEKQKQLDGRKAEFEKLNAEFEKQQQVLSEGAKRDKATDLQRRMVELQRIYQQLQGDLANREQEMTGGIYAKMRVIVKEIAEADGFAMVIEDRSLVYAQPSLDLTNELIRKYNGKHPSTGAAPAAAAAKGKASPAKPAAPAGDKAKPSAPAGDKK
ncbi:MAG: OmpH family outer membrane protein [Anaeromyxobacteraceae bacterium]